MPEGSTRHRSFGSVTRSFGQTVLGKLMIHAQPQHETRRPGLVVRDSSSEIPCSPVVGEQTSLSAPKAILSPRRCATSALQPALGQPVKVRGQR